MVNLKKWEVVEHKDIREGDKLKIIEVIHAVKGESVLKVHKGTVTDLWPNGDFDLSDGSEWEDTDPTQYNETVTAYRRKAKEREVIYNLPENFGAVVEGIDRKTEKKKRFVWDGEHWGNRYDVFDHKDLKMGWHSFVVLAEGVGG